MAARIKSPLLYQLSYRPKITELFGKLRAWLGAQRSIVPPVYRSRSSESTEDVFEALRGKVSS